MILKNDTLYILNYFIILNEMVNEEKKKEMSISILSL